MGGGNQKPKSHAFQITDCLITSLSISGCRLPVLLPQRLDGTHATRFPATIAENTSGESDSVKCSPLIQCSFHRGPHRLLPPPPNPFPAALPPSAAALLRTAVRGPMLQLPRPPSPQTLCGRYTCPSSSPPLLLSSSPPHPVVGTSSYATWHVCWQDLKPSVGYLTERQQKTVEDAVHVSATPPPWRPIRWGGWVLTAGGLGWDEVRSWPIGHTTGSCGRAGSRTSVTLWRWPKSWGGW